MGKNALQRGSGVCSPPGRVHRGVGPLGHPQALRFSRGLLQPEEVITRNPVFQGTFDLSGKRVNVRSASPAALGLPPRTPSLQTQLGQNHLPTCGCTSSGAASWTGDTAAPGGPGAAAPSSRSPGLPPDPDPGLWGARGEVARASSQGARLKAGGWMQPTGGP